MDFVLKTSQLQRSFMNCY